MEMNGVAKPPPVPRRDKPAGLPSRAGRQEARPPSREIGSISIPFPFSLESSLDSGQAFGWKQMNSYWVGSVRGVGFALRQNKQSLEYHSSIDPEDAKLLLQNYLALDTDPSVIAQDFQNDAFLKSAMDFCSGLRILRQDPWECLAGFILSSTKQIIHIQQIWHKMCQRWGKEMTMSSCPAQFRIYSFPKASVIATCSEAELRNCGMGFRAPYLLGAAKRVVAGEFCFDELRKLNTQDARQRLMELDGVGPKIADCVLLFSLNKQDAFPVDTWILKVLKHVYRRNSKSLKGNNLDKFLKLRFGRFPGYAQQYLFHYVRKHPETMGLQKKTKD
jgi:N-glycosylase/DNA lyase